MSPRFCIILSVAHAEELFPMQPQIVAACAKKITEFGAVIVVLHTESTCFTVLVAENGLDCARRAKN